MVHGNALQSVGPGTVTGLNASTDQARQHADIYAQLISTPKYHARISG